jgi:glycerol kinase
MAVIAIDAGTTGIRTVAFDEEANIIASAYSEFPQHYPAPGLVEHDLVEIWSTTLKTLEEVTQTVPASSITAVGITNQRETACIWDGATGRPLARAIVWQDRRTAPRCEELRSSGLEDEIRKVTGLVIDPYFSATKFEWLLSQIDRGESSTPLLGTIDSWLIWNLTGGKTHATDWSNASRTLLFDIRELRWAESLCSTFGVPAEMLPDPLPSCHLFGETVPERAAGIAAPIGGVLGDQQAALFGQACFEVGMAKNTYGTGSFVLVNLGPNAPQPAKGLLTTVAWGVDGKPVYALEGSIFVTGAALQWLRDGLGLLETAAETEPIATSVADTGDVYFVPALTGLGSPWWDPYARGLIIGITRGTNRAHLVRAAVEAMAYQTRDVIEAIRQASTIGIEELRVDGGASVMDLLCQLQADLLGVPVRRPQISETTAMGAAFAAGLSAGVWDSLTSLRALWKLDRSFEPCPEREEVEARYRRWLAAVARAREWASESP